MEFESVLKTANGLLDLGLFEEAAKELTRVPEEEKARPAFLRALLRVQLALGHSKAAAETAAQLRCRDKYLLYGALDISIALSFAGRLIEARSVMEAFAQFKMGYPSEAYHMACLESRLGKFEAATRWLHLTLQQSEVYCTKAPFDSDLIPLWKSVRSEPLTLEQAHLLLDPCFDVLLGKSAGDLAQKSQIDSNDLRAFPESWKRLFRFDPTKGLFTIHALTATQFPFQRDACLAWFRKRAEIFLRNLQIGRERALTVVLAAQCEYALKYLQIGNYFAARCHLLWALAKKPEFLSEYRCHKDLHAMRFLLDEIHWANGIDPQWSHFLVRACFPSAEMNVPELLEDVPVALRNTSLYLLQIGSVAQENGDYVPAVQSWIKLSANWAKDIVGYANGVTCLLHMRMWDRARTLLCLAPRAYRSFHLCRSQCRQLRLRNIEADAPPATLPLHWQPEVGRIAKGYS